MLWVIVIVLMAIVSVPRHFSETLRTACTWTLTLLPLILYCLLEVFIWRGKRKWVATASVVEVVNSNSNEVAPTDEENPPAEVSSPVHHQTDDNGDGKDEDEDEDEVDVDVDVEIELPEIKKNRRKPSMIKTPSSKPSIPVTTLTQKFEKNQAQI